MQTHPRLQSAIIKSASRDESSSIVGIEMQHRHIQHEAARRDRIAVAPTYHMNFKFDDTVQEGEQPTGHEQDLPQEIAQVRQVSCSRSAKPELTT